MRLLKILNLVQDQQDLLKWLAHVIGAVCIKGAEVSHLPEKHGILWPGEQMQCLEGCELSLGLISLSLD